MTTTQICDCFTFARKHIGMCVCLILIIRVSHALNKYFKFSFISVLRVHL